MASYTTRPLSDRTWLRDYRKRERTPFDTAWTKTLALLEREVAALDGRYLVIGIDVTEKDLRLDGTLRARARAESPAVEVAFDSKHGPMLYRCDRYTSRYYDQGGDWQQNVRAIAKTLEALRAVDRYGAAETGEQYRGYQQLAAFPAPPSPQAGHATARLLEIAGYTIDSPDVPDQAGIIRRARRRAHPDNGGNHELWHEVEALTHSLGGEH